MIDSISNFSCIIEVSRILDFDCLRPKSDMPRCASSEIQKDQFASVRMSSHMQKPKVIA